MIKEKNRCSQHPRHWEGGQIKKKKHVPHSNKKLSYSIGWSNPLDSFNSFTRQGCPDRKIHLDVLMVSSRKFPLPISLQCFFRMLRRRSNLPRYININQKKGWLRPHFLRLESSIPSIHYPPSTIPRCIHCIHVTHTETRLIPLPRARCSSALSMSCSPTRQAKKTLKITKVVREMLPATRKGATGDTWVNRVGMEVL